MISKELMKISRARFGYGGYQDVQVGLSLTFTRSGSRVQSFDGFWATERRENTKWTEQERIDFLGGLVLWLADILDQAKCRTLDELIGKPVEVTFEGGMLREWRILTEVL